MEDYKNKSADELLQLCKSKFDNGRSFEELTRFLNLHGIDADKQKYILDELDRYAKQPKDNIKSPNKKILFSPTLLAMGIVFMVLGLIVLNISNMQQGNRVYSMALMFAGAGAVLVLVEITKAIMRFFQK